MKIELYQIDAFANSVFTGNPAAVCPLESWIGDDLMQSIAMENNLAETAFFVPENGHFRIRWFTPATEVDLCGHATLASAHVLFFEKGYGGEEIKFESRSGELSVRQDEELLELNFPAQQSIPCDVPLGLEKALGADVLECYAGEDYLVVLKDEIDVKRIKPDFAALKLLENRGVIVTSAASDYDFVNRFFGPNVGIDEDPVTGSAFTQLIPYWAERLKKSELTAKQVSARGGEVMCRFAGNRVFISGRSACYLRGAIDI